MKQYTLSPAASQIGIGIHDGGTNGVTQRLDTKVFELRELPNWVYVEFVCIAQKEVEPETCQTVNRVNGEDSRSILETWLTTVVNL